MKVQVRLRNSRAASQRCLAAATCCAAMLAGCESPPKDAPVPARPAPAPTPPPAPPPPPPLPVAPPPVQLSDPQVKQLLEGVRNLLDQGQVDAATVDLERILGSDKSNKTANSLMRQIRESPTDLYGRESFNYRVQQGDTLALLAQRYLNDRDQFYGLARYNSITVPRQLQLGQTIRIPGKQRMPAPMPPQPSAASAASAAPAASAPSAPSAPIAPAPTPTPATASAPGPSAAPTAAAEPDPALEAARVEREKKAAVERWTRQARASMARQDVCGAISAWDEVLKVDPSNRTAALEREKALELKKRLPGSKC